MTGSGDTRPSFPTLARTGAALAMALLLWVPSFALAQEEIVCIQCHGALQGKLGAPVELWRKSIHAGNGIACNNCHGGDPKDAASAMSPARGFLGAPGETAIPPFCGRCHPGVLKDYLQSAHGRALGKGGPTCVTCHGNHLVVKASLEIINEKRCSQCHSYERARLIKEAMQVTESRIVGIDEKIDRFKGRGVDTDRLEKGLFAVRNHFHTLFHSVDVALVNSEAASIGADLAKLDAAIREITTEQARRKIIGAFAVGLALLAALLFHLLRRNYP